MPKPASAARRCRRARSQEADHRRGHRRRSDRQRPRRSAGSRRLGRSSAGGDTIAAALRQAGADDDVAAVVLRVDSPGGSVTGSETIWREVSRLRQKGKPVVASMGAVAASGGYYVSMAADTIVANPATITGSIGVVTGKLVARELKERLGWDRIRCAPTTMPTRGRSTHRSPSSSRPWSKPRRTVLQRFRAPGGRGAVDVGRGRSTPSRAAGCGPEPTPMSTVWSTNSVGCAQRCGAPRCSPAWTSTPKVRTGRLPGSSLRDMLAAQGFVSARGGFAARGGGRCGGRGGQGCARPRRACLTGTSVLWLGEWLF